MGLQHDNPNALPQDAPRTQRLTADESRAVIARWQQERVAQTGLTDRPALPDVAEGLDIPVEEVQRLLAEVRAQRLAEEAELAREQDLAEIQLAEQKRRLAEIQRQRAELRREQAALDRASASTPVFHETPEEKTYRSLAVVAAALVFLLAVMFHLANTPRHGGQLNPPVVGDCQVTSPDGKSEPCPPYVRDQILHVSQQQPHR